MNRELKFRVWDSISKKLHPWNKINTIPIQDFFREHYVLQQFTGLKDKNGKEIYEGDILNYAGMLSLIEYKQKTVTNYGHGDSTTQMFMGFSISQYGNPFNINEIEVVGNIYENPELLKK